MIDYNGVMNDEDAPKEIFNYPWITSRKGFYFDEIKNEITGMKWGNYLYCMEDNIPFKPGAEHTINLGNGCLHKIRVKDLSKIDRNSVKHHSLIAINLKF